MTVVAALGSKSPWHTATAGMRPSPPVPDVDRAGEIPGTTRGPTPASGAERPEPTGEGAHELRLVDGVRRGEAWAAQEVWDRHGASVRRLLARALGPRAEVEDLTQETFMRVYTRIDGLREAGALREFILAVAVNVLKHELRRRWVRRRVLLSDSGSVPEVEAPSADPEAREALARCYAILDKLGPRERAAFVLRYMEERTLEEVASGMGVSLSTAKRLVNRAAQRVGKHVGNDQGLRDFFEQGQGGAKVTHPGDGPTTDNASAKKNVSR